MKMANALMPNTFNLKVSSTINIPFNMRTQDFEFDRVRIVTLETDRDDVRFIQSEDNTSNLIAVNWYGMYVVPYNSDDGLISSTDVSIGMECSGASGFFEVPFGDFNDDYEATFNIDYAEGTIYVPA